MNTITQDICQKPKIKKKLNLELKGLRIAAGFNGRLEFVEALNAFLDEHNINYRVGVAAYSNYEAGITENISLKTAYYISKFLNCPIETFIEKKLCV